MSPLKVEKKDDVDINILASSSMYYSLEMAEESKMVPVAEKSAEVFGARRPTCALCRPGCLGATEGIGLGRCGIGRKKSLGIDRRNGRAGPGWSEEGAGCGFTSARKTQSEVSESGAIAGLVTSPLPGLHAHGRA